MFVQAVCDVVLAHYSPVVLHNYASEVGWLKQRVVALPKSLNEVLLELDNRLEYLSWNFLQTLTLLVHLLKL